MNGMQVYAWVALVAAVSSFIAGLVSDSWYFIPAFFFSFSAAAALYPYRGGHR